MKAMNIKREHAVKIQDAASLRYYRHPTPPDVNAIYREMMDGQDEATRAALQWMIDNGKWPIETHHNEGRWYPDCPSNRRFFSPEEHGCLIPETVFHSLAFPRVDGWDGPYPWFNPFETAVVALVDALKMQAELAELIEDSRRRDGKKWDEYTGDGR